MIGICGTNICRDNPDTENRVTAEITTAASFFIKPLLNTKNLP